MHRGPPVSSSRSQGGMCSPTDSSDIQLWSLSRLVSSQNSQTRAGPAQLALQGYRADPPAGRHLYLKCAVVTEQASVLSEHPDLC